MKLDSADDAKAVPIFIFVSRPRQGRFLAFHEEKKKTKKMYSCSDCLLRVHF